MAERELPPEDRTVSRPPEVHDLGRERIAAGEKISVPPDPERVAEIKRHITAGFPSWPQDIVPTAQYFLSTEREAALLALRELVSDPDTDVLIKEEIIWLIGEDRIKELLPLINNILQQEIESRDDEGLVSAALKVASKIGSEDSANAIHSLIMRPNEIYMKSLAINALEEIGSEKSPPVLIELAKNVIANYDREEIGPYIEIIRDALGAAVQIDPYYS
ncbi:MAG: hypothetical protein D6719_04110, partial [Candidatus Dadabacteria bacterium]